MANLRSETRKHRFGLKKSSKKKVPVSKPFVPESELRYYMIYKPFRVLSQFTCTDDKKCLADLGVFPEDVYPVGRLDYDSEGLLILTNDRTLNKRLLDPENQHERQYLVQVEGLPEDADMEILRTGISININKKPYTTRPAKVRILKTEPVLPERLPPVRYRKSVPDAWILIQLTEGKNRQVRKMTAGAGFPTLRLVRWSLNLLTIEGLEPGAIVELNRRTVVDKLLKNKR